MKRSGAQQLANVNYRFTCTMHVWQQAPRRPGVIEPFTFYFLVCILFLSIFLSSFSLSNGEHPAGYVVMGLSLSEIFRFGDLANAIYLKWVTLCLRRHRNHLSSLFPNYPKGSGELQNGQAGQATNYCSSRSLIRLR